MSDEKIKEAGAPVVVRGLGVGRGIAIAPLRFDPLRDEIERRSVAEENALLERAREEARLELIALRERAVKSVGEEHGEVYGLRISMLDGELTELIKGRIERGERLLCAIEKTWEELKSSYEKETERQKKAMISHSLELLELLSRTASSAPEAPRPIDDGRSRARPGEKYILVASGGSRDFVFAPDGEGAVGIVCVGGSENSGLAAYARAKGIPTLVVLPEDSPDVKYEGSGAIIDPLRSRLTINPDLAALEKFAARSARAEENEARLEELIGKPSVTRSGRYAPVLATADAWEGASALSADAEGIGLLKTERLFGDDLELSHLAEYREILGMFKEKTVIVRLFDGGVGGENGRRGARFLLAKKEILKGQLRALLRASSEGNIWGAIPMAVSPEEIRRVRAVMSSAESELRSEGLAFGEMRLGAVVDTPAAAICGEAMAAECDFFVIDTDSLAPFALGADGEDPVLAELIRKNPEPVLELIGKAVRAMRASGKGKSVGVAGYLAADTSLTERLLSLGVDFLSVHSPGVLELRERIRNCP